MALSATSLFDVTGKHVVVTGGASGIGFMIAQGFAENGAHVYVASRKPDADAVAKLKGSGHVEAVAADLTRPAGRTQLREWLAERTARVDVLVNNSGTNWNAPIDQYPEHAWDKVMALNAKVPFFLTAALLPLLEAAAAAAPGPARVINVGSIDGLRPAALDTFAYGTSKAAVAHTGKMMARALAGRGITVNTLAPGPFPSRMMKQTLEQMGEVVAASTALGRVGEAADIAGVALLLASRAGAYITGAVIPVDGGALVKASL